MTGANDAPNATFARPSAPGTGERRPTSAEYSGHEARRPLVSVLTPSFEQARWLGDNLASVRDQTYEPIEHIVMDGGSNDGSLDLLERADNPSLHWRSEPDRGQTHALNKAFAESHGEIIGWLNSDDAYFGPTVVAEVVQAFDQRPDVAVVYGHALLVDADGLILQSLWAPPFDRTLLRLQDFIVQPAAFFRRDAIEGELVDESFDYTMDYELWLRLARRHRFARIDRIVAIDRHHASRKSYLLADIGRTDHARLRKMYGIAGGPAGRVARKIYKIGSRLAGSRLIVAAQTEPVVFTAVRDGRRRMLLRQVATPRSSMDEAASAGT